MKKSKIVLVVMIIVIALIGAGVILGTIFKVPIFSFMTVEKSAEETEGETTEDSTEETEGETTEESAEETEGETTEESTEETEGETTEESTEETEGETTEESTEETEGETTEESTGETEESTEDSSVEAGEGSEEAKDGFEQSETVWEENNVTRNDVGQITFISGHFTDIEVTDKESALSVLVAMKDELGIENPNESFSCFAENTSEYLNAYRFEQEYKGYTVYGRALSVCADPDDNEAYILSGHCIKDEILAGMSLEIPLSAEDIMVKYEGYFTNKELLMIYAEGESGTNPELVYLLIGDEKNLLVSVDDGEILEEIDTLSYLYWEDNRDAGVYAGNKFEYKDDKVDIVVYNSLDKNAPEDAECKAAANNLIEISKFFEEKLNRNSLDNNGMSISIFVHSWQEDTWVRYAQAIVAQKLTQERIANGEKSMTYAKDALMHECTHGMVFYASTGLEYNGSCANAYRKNNINITYKLGFPFFYKKSLAFVIDGAIYEGLSDVMAFFIDGCDATLGEAMNPTNGYIRRYDVAPPFYNSIVAAVDKSYGRCYFSENNYDYGYSVYLSHAAWALRNEEGLEDDKNLQLWYSVIMKSCDRWETLESFFDGLLAVAKKKFSEEDYNKVVKVLAKEGFTMDTGRVYPCLDEVTNTVNNIDVSLEYYLVGDSTPFYSTTHVYPEVPTTYEEGQSSSIYDEIMKEDAGITTKKERDTLPLGKYTLKVGLPAGYETAFSEYEVNLNKKDEIVDVFIDFIKVGDAPERGQNIQFIDASTGAPVDGVTMKYAHQYNNRNGMIEGTMEPLDPSGEKFAGCYQLMLKRGFYTLAFEKEGYETTYVDNYVHRVGAYDVETYSLTPKNNEEINSNNIIISNQPGPYVSEYELEETEVFWKDMLNKLNDEKRYIVSDLLYYAGRLYFIVATDSAKGTSYSDYKDYRSFEGLGCGDYYSLISEINLNGSFSYYHMLYFNETYPSVIENLDKFATNMDKFIAEKTELTPIECEALKLMNSFITTFYYSRGNMEKAFQYGLDYASGVSTDYVFYDLVKGYEEAWTNGIEDYYQKVSVLESERYENFKAKWKSLEAE